MKNQLFFSAFLLLSLLFLLPHITTNVNAAPPTCPMVTTNAASCLSYAMGKDPKPSQACCNGLQALAKTVKNVDDKKAICRCLKASVKNLKGVQDKFLGQIPAACKITVGFPVSISVNCETIH